jgi:hypothetical protein
MNTQHTTTSDRLQPIFTELDYRAIKIEHNEAIRRGDIPAIIAAECKLLENRNQFDQQTA